MKTPAYENEGGDYLCFYCAEKDHIDGEMPYRFCFGAHPVVIPGQTICAHCGRRVDNDDALAAAFRIMEFIIEYANMITQNNEEVKK